MTKKQVTWEDLNREIFGLKGAIFGAKVGLYHGGKVTKEVIETLQELTVRIHNMIDTLEKGRLEAELRLPVECPNGGNHRWESVCEKCGMKIFFNLDIFKNGGGNA